MERDALLIDPERLAELLVTDSPPRLLDVRWTLGGPPGVDEYRRGHLPGARFLDMDRDLAAPVGDGSRGRHPLPERERIWSVLCELGVVDSDRIVVYDARTGLSAARAWWQLRALGHPEVLLLDGGLSAWVRAGLPVVAGDDLGHTHPAPARGGSHPPAEQWTPRDPKGVQTVDAEGVLAGLARPNGPLLLDARSSERYRGEPSNLDPVAGHIPGAISAPTLENLKADGTFADSADLARRFVALGVSHDRPVVSYCGSGITATHQILALLLAGYSDVALYPGSWSEWIRDATRPVARDVEGS